MPKKVWLPSGKSGNRFGKRNNRYKDNIHLYVAVFGQVERPGWVGQVGIKRRLAVDFNLFKGGKYLTATEDHQPLGEYWESIGSAWDGRWGGMATTTAWSVAVISEEAFGREMSGN